jgi:M6 family metalloprotease-like protein
MPTPYLGEEIDLFNPDGTRVHVRAWGNQFQAVFETLNGYTVVPDGDSGFYHYAQLSDDQSELVPSAFRVGEANPADLALPRHARVSPVAARRDALEARELGVRPRWETRREQRRERLRAMDRSAEAAPPPAATVGNYTGLCILVQFPDVPGTIAVQEVDDFCNKVGYSGFGNAGSAYDYFLSVSDGKLHYHNVVTAYYTAAHNRSYYTDPAIPFGTRARELIVEALQDLKNHGFDFSQLSSDTDNYVYALSVFYAGSRVNNWSQGLWPHSWALASPFQASPTKRFSDYQITDMGSQLTLRTFCHENGHMVCDFPDLYDYGSESNGVGHYCLMCYGGPNTNPTQISAYLKNSAGWTNQLTTLAPGMTAMVNAGTNDFLMHRRNATEYFICENREQTGRDAGLPDAGLAIWHVDELGNNSNEQMTPASHYELSLEQADNQFDLEKRVNAGDSGDLYSAVSVGAFGGASSPSSAWWDGAASELEIESVSAAGSSITITTKGSTAMTSIVGTWNIIGVSWAGGPVLKAGPFTFNADGTWTYQFGGGRWLEEAGVVVWNFTNASGLVYTANTQANSMTGIMGYLTPNGLQGSFYALRAAPPPAPSAIADESPDAATHSGADEQHTDPAIGPVN